MEVDAEAAEALNAVGGVGDAVLAVEALGMAGQSGNHGGFDFRAIENAGFNLAYFTVDAHARRSALYQEQVAAAERDDGGKPAAQGRGG